MRDSSLDEFLGGSDSDGGGEEPDEDAVDEAEGTPETDAGDDAEAGAGDEIEADDTGTEQTSEPTEEDTPAELTVEPATPTYDWSPEGAECAECGTRVETRWHAEGVGLVCEDCKVW